MSSLYCCTRACWFKFIAYLYIFSVHHEP